VVAVAALDQGEKSAAPCVRSGGNRTGPQVTPDLVDFQVSPSELGWYGVICLSGGSRTRRLPLYWDGKKMARISHLPMVSIGDPRLTVMRWIDDGRCEPDHKLDLTLS
jgi:hypothetical protein